MSNENASKSWIIYCALFAGIIVISALYVIEIMKHATSKEVNNFHACSMQLQNCDFELHMIEKKYIESIVQLKECQNAIRGVNNTGAKLILDIYKNGEHEDILPSNHQKYKYSTVSSAATLNNLDYLIMWCFIIFKCFILFYYILP